MQPKQKNKLVLVTIIIIIVIAAKCVLKIVILTYELVNGRRIIS